MPHVPTKLNDNKFEIFHNTPISPRWRIFDKIEQG